MEQVRIDININPIQTVRPGYEIEEDTITSQEISFFKHGILEIKDNVQL